MQNGSPSIASLSLSCLLYLSPRPLLPALWFWPQNNSQDFGKTGTVSHTGICSFGNLSDEDLSTNHCAVPCAMRSGVVTCFAGGKPIICLFSHCISPGRTPDAKAHDGRGMQQVCLISHAKFSSFLLLRMHKTGRWNMEGVEEDELPRRSLARKSGQ